MIWIARIYFALILAMVAAVGLYGLIQPNGLIATFDLLPKTTRATAEMRGLYGGAMISWALAGLAAWRFKSLRPGLLVGLGLTLGLIAVVRAVSIAVDHQAAFNLPALASEALFALACWALYRHDAATT
jgi:hypothetical protein